MSVISVLPAVAIKPVGRGRASASGVAMVAMAESLFPQSAIVVQPFTARTRKVYSVPSVRLPMV